MQRIVPKLSIRALILFSFCILSSCTICKEPENLYYTYYVWHNRSSEDIEIIFHNATPELTDDNVFILRKGYSENICYYYREKDYLYVLDESVPSITINYGEQTVSFFRNDHTDEQHNILRLYAYEKSIKSDEFYERVIYEFTFTDKYFEELK